LAINGRLIAEPDKSSHNPTLQMGTAAKISAGAGQYSRRGLGLATIYHRWSGEAVGQQIQQLTVPLIVVLASVAWSCSAPAAWNPTAVDTGYRLFA